MEKLIIWIVLLVFFYLMNRISTWKKRAATAFLVVGQRATTKEERKWGYRNALRAGEQKAERFYVYSALEDFMDGWETDDAFQDETFQWQEDSGNIH